MLQGEGNHSHQYATQEALIPLPKQNSSSTQSNGSHITNVKSQSSKTILDGFYLLEATGMGFPDDARQVLLADKGLVSVVEEDLIFFKGLVFMDLSENRLDLAPFGVLPQLKELRLACNQITHINERLYGFGNLMFLDLSYNNLTLASLQALDCLESLKELDLCGNNLKTLPPEMHKFQALEKLLLEHNKIDDNNIFSILSTLPQLRHLSVAYNFLWMIPPECCSDGYFRLLDVLDLSFNYFARECDISSLMDLPRLQTLMLYGNPVLGPTGEDPLCMYIEDLLSISINSRIGTEKKHVEMITQIPRKRNFKKGQPMGRQALYRDFDIVQVDTEVHNKSTAEWRKEGQKSLFAEAVSIARKQQQQQYQSSVSVDMTFITSAHDDKVDQNEMIAEDVMDRVATEMGLTSSAEIFMLQDQAMLPRSIVNSEGEVLPQEKVPLALFKRTLGNPAPIATHPIAAATAAKALKFALDFPLTNYSEVPAKGFVPPYDYCRPTVTSSTRKVKMNVNRLTENKQSNNESFKSKFSNNDKGKNTLSQIEEVLDKLNVNTDEIIANRAKKGAAPSKDDLVAMKSFAKPTAALRGLVGMVNEVIDEISNC